MQSMNFRNLGHDIEAAGPTSESDGELAEKIIGSLREADEMAYRERDLRKAARNAAAILADRLNIKAGRPEVEDELPTIVGAGRIWWIDWDEDSVTLSWLRLPAGENSGMTPLTR